MTVKVKDINTLWKKYEEEGALEDRHKLMLHYMWLVKYVLQQISLPANSILNEEDFLNIGMIGLHEAIERYEPDRGVKFESFAVPRIRGMIRDELRKLDWLSRTARKKAHDYLHASDSLRSEKGREVTQEEIMEKLNISPDKYNSYLQAAAAAKASMSLFEPTVITNEDDEVMNILEEVPDTQESYLDTVENEERIRFLTDYLQDLSERKRLVMTLYYYEELNFKEIGKVLNVSESRVCQIHTQVLSDMKKKLYEFDNA